MTAQTPDALAEVIALLHRAGQTLHVPLLQAARQGLIALRFIPPGERVPVRALDPTASPLPTVTVLCGDDHSDRCRPSDFPQAVRWLRWARAIALHDDPDPVPWSLGWVTRPWAWPQARVGGVVRVG